MAVQRYLWSHGVAEARDGVSVHCIHVGRTAGRRLRLPLAGGPPCGPDASAVDVEVKGTLRRTLNEVLASLDRR